MLLLPYKHYIIINIIISGQIFDKGSYTVQLNTNLTLVFDHSCEFQTNNRVFFVSNSCGVITNLTSD